MKSKHLQKIISLRLFSAGLTSKHLQKIMSLTLSSTGLTSKHLQKVAMIMSCIGLTNLYSTEFRAIAHTLDGTEVANKTLELEQEEIDSVKQQVLNIGKWDIDSELAKKLFGELNDRSGDKFYDFIPQVIDRERDMLTLTAAVAKVRFRVEKSNDKIYILEPGIENNVCLYVSPININDQGVYSRWQDLVDIVPDSRVDGVSLSGDDPSYMTVCFMTNLNQMPELLHTLNFSRSLAKQTNRSVDDIRIFLSCLHRLGLGSLNNQTTIIKHSEAKHYFLNLMYENSLIVELHFKDESDDTEWYEDEYARARTLNFNDPIFPDIVDGRSFILQSITLGTYTYKFTRRVDLLKEHDGVTLLDLGLGGDTIQERLRKHIMVVFSANRIGREHRNLEEPYSRIDLKEVMQGIEQDFADD